MASLNLFDSEPTDSQPKPYSAKGVSSLGFNKYESPTFGKPSQATITMSTLGYGLGSSFKENMSAIFATPSGKCDGTFVDGKCVPFDTSYRDQTQPPLSFSTVEKIKPMEEIKPIEESPRNDQMKIASEKAGGVDKKPLDPPKTKDEKMEGRTNVFEQKSKIRQFLSDLTGYSF